VDAVLGQQRRKLAQRVAGVGAENPRHGL
jgi:hypothetical protein